MTRLRELHKRLARLRRRRQRVRWETAYSGLALALLLIAAAAFLLDWWLALSRGQRLVALIAAAVLVLWALRRYTLPWLGHRETELDVALLVERQEHIDSDLVAAVQFESPEASGWGSLQLEQAVIEQVAAASPRIDVMRGLSRPELLRRTKLLAVAVVAWIGLAALCPQHLAVFFQRFFLLSPIHYPTRTQIATITIKCATVQPNVKPQWNALQGTTVDPTAPGATPARALFGQQLRFEVACQGRVPQEGRAELSAQRSGLRKTLELKPVEGRPGVFAAELEQVREEISYQFYLGDAWTDPGRLDIAQLPVVEVSMEVQPPAYAAGPNAKPVAMPPGLRQVSVIEGSRILVRLRANKPLQDARFSIEKQHLGFHRVGPDPVVDQLEVWVLDAADSPLGAVVEPIRYQIQVTDTDGLRLEPPVDGIIRLQADAPPRIAGGIITRNVLPTAQPTVYYRAVDDYGVQRVSIAAEITHAGSKNTLEREIEIYKLPAGRAPQRNLDQAYPFDLKTLSLKEGDKTVELKKGDTVTMTLRATDYRGPRSGKTTSADPLVFEVTDEQGILAGMLEADRHSARQLQIMIQRQLGIGESP